MTFGHHKWQWVVGQEPETRPPEVPQDPCLQCEPGGVCSKAECGRKRSSELMRLYGTAGAVPASEERSHG